MLRFLSIATLVLVALCLAVGASIALADDGVPQDGAAPDRTIEAVDPDRRMIDESLASIADVYEFGFTVGSNIEPNLEPSVSSEIFEI